MSNAGLDFSVSSKQLILDLINRDNGRDLTLNDVDLVNPTPNPSNYPRNTNIQMVALPNSGYSGTWTAHYNRLDLGVFFGATTPAIIADNLESTHEALSFVNETYGLGLSGDDIELEALAGHEHVFKVKADSFAWTGQFTLEIVPTVGDGLTDLFTVLTVKNFNEFDYPQYDVNLDWDMETVNFDGFDYGVAIASEVSETSMDGFIYPS